jgi:nicotinate phosphoribosyltransferase
MAYAYWKNRMAERESVFNLFYRENPFGGGYAITCGLDYVVDYLEHFKFTESDVEFLSTIKSKNGDQLFEDAFLRYLAELKFTCDVDAIPEGTLVFPHEPIIRVIGPVLQGQIIETPLLNIINFQTLVATKASRIAYAANGDPVLEFGLRRAQGVDGAIAASRAAYIGGCSSTSNVLAGKLFDIPVAGTHAHSWIMTFDSEIGAFQAYADALPDNCVFLVDTYDTLEGVKNAVEVGKVLRKKGKEMVGIRIDSGDLAYFSQQARIIMDAAGFEKAQIIASNDLNEILIQSLKMQDARISVWGIGTKLVTAYDQPALGAVYKLSAIRNENGKWEDKLKLSEQSVKVNNPGIQQVRRYYQNDKMVADMIYDINIGTGKKNTIYHPVDATKRKIIDEHVYDYKDLLIPVFRKGEKEYVFPGIKSLKNRVESEMNSIHKGIKRFENPHVFPVGLEESLLRKKMDLILNLRKYETT